MTGLPNNGDRVKVWPRPGRRVLANPFPADAPLLAQATYLPKSGQLVVWDHFRYTQLLAGDILLHHPPCEEHDHGDDGVDDCRHCGRTLSEAQVYNVHLAHGKAAAAAEAEARAAADKAAADKAADERKALVAARKQAAEEAAKAAMAALEPQTTSAAEAPAPSPSSSPSSPSAPAAGAAGETASSASSSTAPSAAPSTDKPQG